MVGPFQKGDDFRGISSVLSSYFTYNKFKGYYIDYVATSHRGNVNLKIIALGISLVRYTFKLLFTNTKIVHIHTADFRSFPRKGLYVLLAYIFRKKIILHIHGAQFREFYTSSSKMLRALISKILDLADTIIVLSEFWLKYFQTITITPNIRILFNPVDGAGFDSRPHDYSKKTKDVLYMTMLYARKGIYDLLEAIPIVIGAEPSARFLLCGEGDIAKCRNICKEKGIIDNVKFCGYVTGQAKIDKLFNADIFVLPTHFEGFPISMIEAMFNGLPIITTPVGGIPDVFVDGVNGFLVQPGDVENIANRLIRLLKDTSLRKKMGEKNANRARELFDVNVVMKKLCQLYKETLELQS